jgi:hypothetical protein
MMATTKFKARVRAFDDETEAEGSGHTTVTLEKFDEDEDCSGTIFIRQGVEDWEDDLICFDPEYAEELIKAIRAAVAAV